MCIFTLKGKTALITGGGTGIGLGIAEQFVKAGAKVVITGRRENILKEAVCKLGNSAYYFVHDATQLSPSKKRLHQLIYWLIMPGDI